MTEQMDGQLSFVDVGLWSGKMSQAPTVRQGAPISQQSSKRSSKSQSRMPMCVCVSRTVDGQRPGVITLKMEPGRLLGEHMTHSFGERPSEENASRLSQILQASPHPKYSLSARACEGILRRAQNRGKELPKELKAALEAQSVSQTADMKAEALQKHFEQIPTELSRASASRNEPENLGGGKGILIQDEHVGALSTVNNQSVLAVDVYNQQITGEISASLTAACGGSNTSGGKVLCLNDQGGSVMGTSVDVTGTLRAEMGGHPPLVMNEPAVLPFNTTQITSAANGNHPHYGDPCHTLAAGDHPPAIAYGISAYESNSMKSDNPHSGIYEADTARTLDLNGGNPACNQGGIAIVYENHASDSRVKRLGDIGETVSAKYGTGGNNQPLVLESNQNHAKVLDKGIVNALPAAMGEGGGYVPMVCEKSDTYQDVVGTVDCGIAKGTGNQLANQDMFVTKGAAVRRLTPLECERLQGFPDGWTDIGEWVDSKGKKHKDSDTPRYKALGNSIAVGYANNRSGFWCWMARRICAQYERQATMASLFDGIGGFPLAFEAAGAKAVWASEIEEFPIAVTKLRFPEEEA